MGKLVGSLQISIFQKTKELLNIQLPESWYKNTLGVQYFCKKVMHNNYLTCCRYLFDWPLFHADQIDELMASPLWIIVILKQLQCQMS